MAELVAVQKGAEATFPCPLRTARLDPSDSGIGSYHTGHTHTHSVYSAETMSMKMCVVCACDCVCVCVCVCVGGGYLYLLILKSMRPDPSQLMETSFRGKVKGLVKVTVTYVTSPIWGGLHTWEPTIHQCHNVCVTERETERVGVGVGEKREGAGEKECVCTDLNVENRDLQSEDLHSSEVLVVGGASQQSEVEDGRRVDAEHVL